MVAAYFPFLIASPRCKNFAYPSHVIHLVSRALRAIPIDYNLSGVVDGSAGGLVSQVT